MALTPEELMAPMTKAERTTLKRKYPNYSPSKVAMAAIRMRLVLSDGDDLSETLKAYWGDIKKNSLS
ncbi:MAG TPA: hypothetical protein V6D20_01320 [Candidatus Obscuribacterales bacterium]